MVITLVKGVNTQDVTLISFLVLWGFFPNLTLNFIFSSLIFLTNLLTDFH